MKLTMSAVTLLAVCGLMNSANATTCTTTNSWNNTTGSFSNTAKWSLGVVPSGTHIAEFNDTSFTMTPYTFSFDASPTFCQLRIKRAHATFNSSGGTRTVTLTSTGSGLSDSSLIIAGEGITTPSGSDITLSGVTLEGNYGVMGRYETNILYLPLPNVIRVAGATIDLEDDLVITADTITNVYVGDIYRNSKIHVGGTLRLGYGFLGDAYLHATRPSAFTSSIEADTVILGDTFSLGFLVMDGGEVVAASGLQVTNPLGAIIGDGGQVIADVTLDGGMSPGAAPNTLGTLNVDGGVEMSSTGYCAFDLSDSTSDLLNVTGAFVADGLLYVRKTAGSDPAAGSARKIVDASGGVSGQFNTVDWGTIFSDCRSIKVRYCGDEIWVIVAGALGDVNYDGIVDFSDTNLVLNNFSMSGCVVAGDADFDGDVDFTDLNIVNNNYSNTCN